MSSTIIHCNIDSIEFFDFWFDMWNKGFVKLKCLLFAIVIIIQVKLIGTYTIFNIHLQIFFCFHPINTIVHQIERIIKYLIGSSIISAIRMKKNSEQLNNYEMYNSNLLFVWYDISFINIKNSLKSIFKLTSASFFPLQLFSKQCIMLKFLIIDSKWKDSDIICITLQVQQM